MIMPNESQLNEGIYGCVVFLRNWKLKESSNLLSTQIVLWTQILKPRDTIMILKPLARLVGKGYEDNNYPNFLLW